MKNFYIEVWFDQDRIFEESADTKEEVLEVLNCFSFSNKHLYFTVKDSNTDRVVPHYYYNEWSDSIEY